MIADANGLKQNVTRYEAKYDRLQTLLVSVDISKSTDLETLAILEHASPARRTYREEAILLRDGTLEGISLGVVLVAAIKVGERRRQPAPGSLA